MVADTEYNATHTTPDSLSINYYLKLMNDAGGGVLLYGGKFPWD